MLTAVSAIVVFCVIIFIHEFGHFITAKLFKMTVHEFSIGMGPKLFGFARGGTEYTLRALPLGGFVRLEGEDGGSDDVNAFCNKSAFARFVVLASGAVMNFILGFVIFVFIMSQQAGFYTNITGEVLPDSAFADAGVVSGDRIVKMSGEDFSSKISDYNDINLFVYKNGNNSSEITFERDGETFVKSIAPKYSEADGRYLYGFRPYVEPKSFGGVFKYAYYNSVYVIKAVVISLTDLIRGMVSVSEMSGPVGIVGEIGNAARSGILSLLSLAALISINLGVMNLLPIPALDGGRLLFILIEIIRRKPLPAEKEAIVHAVGFALLIAFMLVITFFDITKLFA
ncbi:MAG: RIP metalloprotease RseP [Clostridia bacterium]|nr:RIP metalloprotease RseP [Clostridia bacterium]